MNGLLLEDYKKKKEGRNFPNAESSVLFRLLLISNIVRKTQFTCQVIT